MLIINETEQIQEHGSVFERTYFMRGARRRCIEICIAAQEGVTYETLRQTFADGASIVRREERKYMSRNLVKEATETEEAVYEEVEKTSVKDYPLTNFTVAGDIIDKRDGTFIVYMGEKTDNEIKDEQIAELLLMVGGAQ